MGHEFELSGQADVEATPEQVWQAIATGPGIDSWFMGRNEIAGGVGGTVRTAFGSYTPSSTVTAWEPGQRLAYRSEPAPDGRFVAYEFLIEGRDRGSTVLRMVTSGFLLGDDWEAEYDAMTKGCDLFFGTLVQYLSHFAGRTATPVTAFGPPVADWDRAWAALTAALRLAGPATEGSRVRIDGIAGGGIDGVVYFTNPHTLGIRTGDALYRFLQGFQGPMIAAHHIFAETDRAETEHAWQTWLDRIFA